MRPRSTVSTITLRCAGWRSSTAVTSREVDGGRRALSVPDRRGPDPQQGGLGSHGGHDHECVPPSGQGPRRRTGGHGDGERLRPGLRRSANPSLPGVPGRRAPAGVAAFRSRPRGGGAGGVDRDRDGSSTGSHRPQHGMSGSKGDEDRGRGRPAGGPGAGTGGGGGGRARRRPGRPPRHGQDQERAPAGGGGGGGGGQASGGRRSRRRRGASAGGLPVLPRPSRPPCLPRGTW